jgi:hypothetical protein
MKLFGFVIGMVSIVRLVTKNIRKITGGEL